MSWIKNVATIVFSTFIAFLIAEILLRMLGIGYGNAPLERSPLYHHVHPSNYQFLMHDPRAEYGGYNVYYDDLGFRVRDKSSQTLQLTNEENAIIFLGDSFTEGNQVTYDETFVALVGEDLRMPSLNFGVTSYSPLIYELQIENILSSFDANTVVLQVFSNDFASDEGYLENALVEEGKITGIDGGKNNYIISLARNSYLLRFLQKSQLLLRAILSNTNTNANASGPISAFDVEQTVTEGQLQNTVQIIQRINISLIEQGKKLYVFLIPSKSLSSNNDCCDADVLFIRFYAELEEINVNTIDVRSSFENNDNQHKLFFEEDIHLTTLGHREIATSIVSHFKNE